jgi:hypothetical protein
LLAHRGSLRSHLRRLVVHSHDDGVGASLKAREQLAQELPEVLAFGHLAIVPPRV